MDSPFRPEDFAREDDASDAVFYTAPRLLVHIDDAAIEAVQRLYAELLPREGDLLDLMSSYRSHMPPEIEGTTLTGLGMNEVELRANPQLTERVVHDLNQEPRLPFADDSFDGAVITVSVQYLTRPIDVFRDLARVLRPGSPLIVTYSNRMFPTKAVRVWRELGDRDRVALIAKYLELTDAFRPALARDCTVRASGYTDPLYGVWAYRRA